MKKLRIKNQRSKVARVKALMTGIGNLIGSVWFYKRSDGELRKMAYRLHVKEPTYEKKPTGKRFAYKKAIDSKKNLITLFDCNCLRYNSKKRLCGRGGWRSVPLDGVVRLKVGGEIYRFV